MQRLDLFPRDGNSQLQLAHQFMLVADKLQPIQLMLRLFQRFSDLCEPTGPEPAPAFQ